MTKNLNSTKLAELFYSLCDWAQAIARSNREEREATLRNKFEAMESDPKVSYGETKHRVRKYVQETVTAEETIYSKEHQRPRDGTKQRIVTPIGTRNVKRTIGRNPGASTYETWITASLGRFTASAPTKDAALRDLANLCTT